MNEPEQHDLNVANADETETTSGKADVVPETKSDGSKVISVSAQAQAQSAMLSTLPSSLKSVFATVLCLNEKDMYVEPSCPICTSKHRAGAEKLFKSFDMYAKNKDESVKEFFEHKQEQYSIDAIRHHMSRHMDRGDQELRKSEWLSKIDLLNANQMSTMQMVNYALSTIFERIVAQSELAPDSKHTKADVEDMQTTNIVALNKVFASLIALRADLLGEMRREGEAMLIPKDSFIKVFDDAFGKATTKEERAIITFIMKGLGGFEAT